MKHIRAGLLVQFDCSPRSCFYTPTKHCEFLRTRAHNTIYYCALFYTPGTGERLEIDRSEVLRHIMCLKVAKNLGEPDVIHYKH